VEAFEVPVEVSVLSAPVGFKLVHLEDEARYLVGIFGLMSKMMIDVMSDDEHRPTTCLSIGETPVRTRKC
jgi:hypothetical protein